MAERGIIVDHFTLHCWVIRLVPLLAQAFRRHKRTVGRRWRMDETCIKVRGSGNICTGLSTRKARLSTFCWRWNATPQQLYASFVRPSVTTTTLTWWPSIKAALVLRRWQRSMAVKPMKKRLLSGRATIWITWLSRITGTSNVEYDRCWGSNHFGGHRRFCAGIELIHMIRKGQYHPPQDDELYPAEQFYLLVAWNTGNVNLLTFHH